MQKVYALITVSPEGGFRGMSFYPHRASSTRAGAAYSATGVTILYPIVQGGNRFGRWRAGAST
jgi:hypothetical protein